MNKNNQIIEKQLGISPDYQYQALRSNNFLQANWHQNKIGIFKMILDQVKPDSLLDLGTGSGNIELIFHKNIKEIVGVDYHKEALDFLEAKLNDKKISNVKLINSDIRDVKNYSKLGKFDLILLMDVIEHLKEKDADSLLAKLNKLLTSDGHICIITPNYKSTWIIIEKILDRFSSLPYMENQQHLAIYDHKNMERLLNKNSYKLILSRTFNLFFFLPLTRLLATEVAKLEYISKYPWGNLLIILAKKANLD